MGKKPSISQTRYHFTLAVVWCGDPEQALEGGRLRIVPGLCPSLPCDFRWLSGSVCSSVFLIIQRRLLGGWEARPLRRPAYEPFLTHSGCAVTGGCWDSHFTLLDFPEKWPNSQQMATNRLLPKNHSRWLISSLGKILPMWDKWN